jgi:hypothetical protein
MIRTQTNGHDDELLINSCANLGLDGFGRKAAHADNIKIKKNKKKKGFVR